MPFHALLFTGLLLLAQVLAHLNSRYGTALLMVFIRWFRWITFSLACGYTLHSLEWLDRPLPVLVALAFMAWLAVETALNWALVLYMSRSDLPMFPLFQENTDGDDFPVSSRAIALRDWLRSQGFRKLVSMKHSFGEDFAVRVSVFQDARNERRIQLLFAPETNALSISLSIITLSSKGEYVITDNSSIPYAAHYPENWFVERHPLQSSLTKLLSIHRKRLTFFGITAAPLPETGLIETFNREQALMEKLNQDKGFLNPLRLHREKGTLSSEGCYRLWKEIWLLKYLGKTVDD